MKRSALSILLIALIGCSSFASIQDFSSKTIQIGMICSDLDESLQFYKDVVGMVQIERARFDVDADFGKRSGLTDNLPIHVEVLKLGFGPEATQLKLMTFGDRAKKQDNQYIHSNTGIQYLTLMVTNLAPIIDRIKENNIPFLGETPVGLGENHFVLIKDPDGTFVELIGPMEIKPPTQYKTMKEKSGFDKFKKDIPYKTPSRVKVKEEKKSSGGFNFFGLFGKKDKSSDEGDAKTTTVKKAKEVKEESESKKIRNKFKRGNKKVPYKTAPRKNESTIIP